MDETYDVYVVMVPATSEAFDRLMDVAVEWDGVNDSVSYEEGLEIIQRVKGVV